MISEQQAPAGSLAITPAGLDCAGEAKGSVEALVVAVQPGRLALAAAEDASLEAQLTERALGHDLALFDLARILALESADDYPNGPLFWNDVASDFIDRLVAHHSSEHDDGRRVLGKTALQQLRDYIVAHLDEPIDVTALAEIARWSPFHFSRMFSRSVGLTPHRYVVHLRLQRAVELIREGRSGLADIAARTGFADQSHLSRWVRRVYGVSLSQISVDPAE